MSDLEKAAKIWAKVGSKIAAPDTATAGDLAEKNRNIEAYVKATKEPVKSKEEPAPTPSVKDKTKPGARFGDRPGEKRYDVSDMTKPLGSYKNGTPYVPKTGNYKLHEGEQVVPAKENPMNPYNKVTEGVKKPKKTLKSIHTRKAKDGSFIHEHHYHHPAHPMEEHTSKDMEGMQAHLSEHAPAMEAQQPEETGAEAQESALGM